MLSALLARLRNDQCVAPSERLKSLVAPAPTGGIAAFALSRAKARCS
jgi:hypothetical protein